MVGWCDGAEKTSSARAFYLLGLRVGQGPTALAVGAGGSCLDIFSLVYHLFFSFSLSLRDGPIQYRLKYCLKEPLSTKQPTNQLNSAYGRSDGVPKSFGYAKLYNRFDISGICLKGS